MEFYYFHQEGHRKTDYNASYVVGAAILNESGVYSFNRYTIKVGKDLIIDNSGEYLPPSRYHCPVDTLIFKGGYKLAKFTIHKITPFGVMRFCYDNRKFIRKTYFSKNIIETVAEVRDKLITILLCLRDLGRARECFGGLKYAFKIYYSI